MHKCPGCFLSFNRKGDRVYLCTCSLFNSDLQVNSNRPGSFFGDCLIIFHRLYCNLCFNLFLSFLLLFSLLPFVFPLSFPPSFRCFLSPFPHISPRSYKYSSTKIPLSFRPSAGPIGDRGWKKASLETLIARNCCKPHRSSVASGEVMSPRVHSCTALRSTSFHINISIYTRSGSQSVCIYTHALNFNSFCQIIFQKKLYYNNACNSLPTPSIAWRSNMKINAAKIALLFFTVK